MVDTHHLLSSRSSSRSAAETFERSLRWILAIVHRDLQPAEGQDQQLVESCTGILLLEGLGALGQISPQKRSAWSQMIQSCQDPVDGWFYDPGRRNPPAGSTGIKLLSQSIQPTYFALQALNALEEKALYPLKFLDKLLSAKAISAWLESLDWKDILPSSEQVMAILASLIYRNEVDGDRSAATAFHQALDWLQQAQDPKTGLWGIHLGASMSEAIAAGYNFLPYFRYVHRPLRRETYIVDTVLQLLQTDGSLLDPAPRGFYASLGAIHLLAAFTRKFHYRRVEIQQALTRSYSALQDNQLEDGSFSIPAAKNDLAEGQDIYGPFSVQLNQNVPLTTWMHLLGIASVAVTYPEEVAGPAVWRFRRWPVLGYYPPGDSLTDHEQDTAPLWLRPSQNSGLLEGELTNEIPVISVIIPCFDLGLYLPEAIESTLAQSYRDFEIIVVDDGSTDDYTQILLSNLDFPKTRIIRQGNHGLPAARNIGIRQSRGKYICCLDADDKLRQGYFAAAVPILDSQPDVGFVSGWLEMFDEQTGVYRYQNFTLADLLAENQVIEPAIFRREAWEKVGGYCETFSISGIEDWDLWISLIEAGYRAHVLPDVAYDYRIRPDAMSASMYQPAKWGRLCVELFSRHPNSYSKWILNVLEKQGARWAETRNWALDLERAIAWWERQSGLWQREAEESQRVIEKQEAWIDELEQYSVLIEKQQASINELEQELQSRIDEQEQEHQVRIEELEREYQAGIGELEQEHEARSGKLEQEHQVRINALERVRLELEEKVLKWSRFVEDRVWIERKKGSLLKRVWFGLGERLGFIHSNREEGG